MYVIISLPMISGLLIADIQKLRRVLNFTGQKDFAAGLSYVAISRCRTLGGILFEEPFSYSRFQSKASTTVVMRNADYVRRRAEEVPLSPDQSDDENYGSDADFLLTGLGARRQ